MIRITVASIDGNFATLYLEIDWPLIKLKELIESQLNIPKDKQVISLNGHTIIENDNTILSNIGINTNDLLLAVSTLQTNVPNTSPQLRENFLENSKNLIQKWKSNPEALRLLDDPELSNAISSGNELNVARVLENKHKNYLKTELENMMKIQSAALNPMTPESQEIIEKYMHKNRIQQSLINSQEYFHDTNITMLYINIEINKVKLTAFVDTGAQTLISMKCAQSCNISNLIDSRFGGIVHGIGMSKMLGKIHLVEMKLNDTFYPISCVVVDNSSVDFLLGLDTMRYQCQINLPENTFTIGGNNKVKFIESPQVQGEGVIDIDKENKIMTLCRVLGIERNQARQLLESVDWDVERAASLSLD